MRLSNNRSINNVANNAEASVNINIGGSPIGTSIDPHTGVASTHGGSVYFIGELSVNHQQSIDIAINTMKAIKTAGANAIKLQTYRAESLTLDVDNSDFRIAQNSVWDGQSYFELFRQNAMPWEWHQTLYRAAKEIDLDIFSTPFDSQGVQLLQSLNSIAYKIASYEIRHTPLIKQVAKIGKPVLISTGIATDDDIQQAIDACHQVGNRNVILMKCTSAYPATLETLHLQDIPKLQRQFGTPVGLSDHSYSTNEAELVAPPIVATALGAVVIEKHVILERSMQTADSHFSLDPNELKITIDAVRNAEKTMASKGAWNGVEHAQTGGRSIYVANSIRKGEIISENNVAIVRPGLSMHPKHYDAIMGKKANKNLEKGSRISMDDIHQ